MKFYTALALFAVAAVAIPVADPDIDNAQEEIEEVKRASTFGANCDVKGCAAALGPAAAGCGGAAAMAFVDPILDTACLGTALNDAVNKPSECNGCSL